MQQRDLDYSLSRFVAIGRRGVDISPPLSQTAVTSNRYRLRLTCIIFKDSARTRQYTLSMSTNAPLVGLYLFSLMYSHLHVSVVSFDHYQGAQHSRVQQVTTHASVQHSFTMCYAILKSWCCLLKTIKNYVKMSCISECTHNTQTANFMKIQAISRFSRFCTGP
jgi:hypothetical protein